MKKLVSAALCALACVGYNSVKADTAIPHGYAIYDITLNFTEFPELNDYGDWPVEIETLMGQTIIGERISVDSAKTQMVVRAVMDIESMIEYTTTSAYTGRSAFQMWCQLFNYYFNLYSAGSASTGGWVSTNGKLTFADSDKTVEGFALKLSNHFKNRTTCISAANGGSGTTSTFQSLSIALVRKVGNDELPDALKKYNVKLSFHKPLSEAGFKTVTKIELYYPNLFTITIDNPAVSGDGCDYEAQVELNVPSLIAQINSDSYTTGGQSKLRVYGTDESGASKSNTDFVTGVNGKIGTLSTTNECALAVNLGGALRHRNSGAAVRFVNMTILRPPKGLAIIVR